MIIDYNSKQHQLRILSSRTGIACLSVALGAIDDSSLSVLLRRQDYLPIYMIAAIKDEQKRREFLTADDLACIPAEVCPAPTSEFHTILGPAYPSSSFSILNKESVADTIPSIPLPHIVSTYDDILRDREAAKILAAKSQKLFDPILPGSLVDRVAKRMAEKAFKLLQKDQSKSKSSVIIPPPLSLEEFYEQDYNARHQR